MLRGAVPSHNYICCKKNDVDEASLDLVRKSRSSESCSLLFSTWLKFYNVSPVSSETSPYWNFRVREPSVENLVFWAWIWKSIEDYRNMQDKSVSERKRWILGPAMETLRTFHVNRVTLIYCWCNKYITMTVYTRENNELLFTAWMLLDFLLI